MKAGESSVTTEYPEYFMKTKLNTRAVPVFATIILGGLLFDSTRVQCAPIPETMVRIPAGEFRMGDSFNEGYSGELPTHVIFVSAFYMEKFEVTKALWDEVYNWANGYGYSFDNIGAGKAANHPVHTINWHDMVKWCNARSEKEGRTPAYYINAAQTTVYRNGRADLQNSWVKWNSGYGLKPF